MPTSSPPAVIAGWEHIPSHPGFFIRKKDDFICFRPDLYPPHRPRSGHSPDSVMTMTDAKKLRVKFMRLALEQARTEHIRTGTVETSKNYFRAEAKLEAALQALNPTE